MRPVVPPATTMYMADPFDAYFARARLDELEAAQQQPDSPSVAAARRGSLPSPGCTLRVEDVSGCRRTRSCKLPRNKSTRRKSTSKSPSPSPRRTSVENHSRSNSPAKSDHSNTSSHNGTGVSLNYVTEPTLRAPSPRGAGRSCHSAPHSRNASWKKQRRPRSIRGQRESGDASPLAAGDSPPEQNTTRSRSGSGSDNFEDEVAAKLEQLRVMQAEDICPARSFHVSSRHRGLINRGDSFKRKSRHGDRDSTPPVPMLGSVDDGHGDTRQLSSPGSPEEVHKVIVAGDHGVGKTALLHQFMTSAYLGAIETTGE